MDILPCACAYKGKVVDIYIFKLQEKNHSFIMPTCPWAKCNLCLLIFVNLCSLVCVNFDLMNSFIIPGIIWIGRRRERIWSEC